MTPEELLNESEQARSCRERVERLRALLHAGEHADEDIDRALRQLRDDIFDACDRASARIGNARRTRDQLPLVRKRLKRAAAIWTMVRQGFPVEFSTWLYDDSKAKQGERMRQLIGDFDNAPIDDARRIVEKLRAMQEQAQHVNETDCVCRNLSFAIDKLRSIAKGLTGRDET